MKKGRQLKSHRGRKIGREMTYVLYHGDASRRGKTRSKRAKTGEKGSTYNNTGQIGCEEGRGRRNLPPLSFLLKGI